MQELAAQIKLNLPDSKFNPPLYEASKQIFRDTIISELTSGKWAKKKNILIEAQAGQGKTTVVLQYLKASDLPFTWYQVGKEDLDTILFLSSLYVALKESIPSFSAPLLGERLLSGAVSLSDVDILIRFLTEGLCSALHRQHLLVFDDLHLLAQSDKSYELLSTLFQNAPENLCFLSTSRRSVPQLTDSLKSKKSSVLLHNKDISFSKKELYSYCSDVLGESRSLEEISALHDMTDGWITGILLLKGQPLNNSFSHRLTPEVSVENQDLLTYFLRNLEDFSSVEDIDFLLKLSLLDDIPFGLNDFLSEDMAVKGLLENLVSKKFFIQLHRDDSGFVLYRFHHLFRDILNAAAVKKISVAERTIFLKKTASWFLDNDKPLIGVRYFFACEDYESAHEVFHELGLLFISQNLHITLYNFLRDIPSNIIEKYPWFSLVYGIATVDFEPQKSMHYLENARVCFSTEGDDFGEIYALSQLVVYHLGLDANYAAISVFLPRLEKLFLNLSDHLDPYSIMHISLAIAFGYAFVEGDLNKANFYSDISLQLADELSSQNELSSNLIVKSYISLFSGDWDKCRKNIEASLAMIASPLVNEFNKLYHSLFLVDFLNLSGDFKNFEHQNSLLKRLIENDLLASSVAGPFLLLWEIDVAIAQGYYDEAEALLEKAFQIEFAGSQAHMRSQFFQYAAYLAALKNEKKRALEFASESVQLRKITGGKPFIYLHQMLLAATFSLLGQNDKAKKYFTSAVDGFQQTGDLSILSGALCHKAYWLLNCGRNEEGLDELNQALELMRKKGYRHFYGWNPDMMKMLLESGIKNNILPEFCKLLAKERLDLIISEKEESIPCLKIITLGLLELSAGNERLQASDLTETQRKLLGILISEPNRQKTQEEIQTALWPDINAVKGRKRFDTALGRLRKNLSDAFNVDPLKYLSLQSGVLSLTNCCVDCDDFLLQSRKGLNHFHSEDYWQAGNSFHAALSSWGGPFMTNITIGESGELFREKLLETFFEVSMCEAQILFQFERYEEALEIAKNGLAEDPTNETFNKTIYNCYVKLDQPVKAAKVLQKYEKALQKEEYLTEDIHDIIENFWKPLS